jgi:hypothetical protein
MIQLQSNPNGPDLLRLQRWVLADQLPFVPRYYTPFSLGDGVGNGIHEWLLGSRLFLPKLHTDLEPGNVAVAGFCHEQCGRFFLWRVQLPVR